MRVIHVMMLIVLPDELCPGMNGAVRAVVRMGFHLGCKVYFIKEVSVTVGVPVLEQRSVE